MREQDGLYVCALNCYEENGGTIDRQNERAAGAALAADLSAKEMRAPKQPGWFEDQSITAISKLDPRSVQVTISGASKTMVLTGVGFLAAHTISSDSNITVNKVVDSDLQVTLTISASVGAVKGMHPLNYISTFSTQTLTDVYPNTIDVR